MSFASTAVEGIVLDRYAAASKQPANLCCPPANDPKLFAAVPAELLERDYRCGDPNRYVREGEAALDLGSGAGKACYLLAQIVGRGGKVIGVDMNDPMLALARRHLHGFAEKTGLRNIEFRKGRVQDLALDLEALDRHLAAHPVTCSADVPRMEAEAARLRATAPLAADGSVDVVVSDCVLNLVRPEDKARRFSENHRVLRRGGRAVISDQPFQGDRFQLGPSRLQPASYA